MEQQGQTNNILQGGILAAVGECKKANELVTKAVDLAASAQAGAIKAQVDASNAQADASNAQADATKALQQNAETKQRLNELQDEQKAFKKEVDGRLQLLNVKVDGNERCGEHRAQKEEESNKKRFGNIRKEIREVHEKTDKVAEEVRKFSTPSQSKE